MCILFEKLEIWSIFASLMHTFIEWKSQKVKFQGHLRVTIYFQRNAAETLLSYFGNKCAASCEHSA